jgi:hypothetical protein
METQICMDVDDAAERLRQLLADAGFDPDRPDPAEAWTAFKRFVAEPVDVPTNELWFEANDGDPATDSPGYFDFVRMFTHSTDDGAEWGEQITAHLTAPRNVRLGLQGRSVQAADITDLPLWFTVVEASPAFQAGVKFAGWSFEIRIDGC